MQMRTFVAAILAGGCMLLVCGCKAVLWPTREIFLVSREGPQEGRRVEVVQEFFGLREKFLIYALDKGMKSEIYALGTVRPGLSEVGWASPDMSVMFCDADSSGHYILLNYDFVERRLIPAGASSARIAEKLERRYDSGNAHESKSADEFIRGICRRQKQLEPTFRRYLDSAGVLH